MTIVALTIIAIVTAIFYIDRIAKTAVERAGTYPLGVDTHLESMDIGVFSSTVSIDEQHVTNPDGFYAPHFLTTQQGRVAVWLGTFMEPVVVIPELAMSGITMHLEHKRGTANFNVILEHLKKLESEGVEDRQKDNREADGKEGTKFVIQNLAIDDDDVKAELLPIGGERTPVSVKIERIELADIGSGADRGVLLAKVSGLVTQAILTGVLRNAGGLILTDLMGELAESPDGIRSLHGATLELLGPGSGHDPAGWAGEDLGKDIEEGSKKIGEKLKQVGKQLEDGIQQLLNPGTKED